MKLKRIINPVFQVIWGLGSWIVNFPIKYCVISILIGASCTAPYLLEYLGWAHLLYFPWQKYVALIGLYPLCLGISSMIFMGELVGSEEAPTRI